jgi:hypothetical protein
VSGFSEQDCITSNISIKRQMKKQISKEKQYIFMEVKQYDTKI